MSCRTVSRKLCDSWLHDLALAKRFLISKLYQKACLAFANEHVICTDDKWSRVHFSDESKNTVIGSDKKRFVWQRTGLKLSDESVKKTIKFGGSSVMVWGMMSAAGCSHPVRLQCTVNKDICKQILLQSAIQRLRSTPFLLTRFTFMHDNDPCHTSKKAKSF